MSPGAFDRSRLRFRPLAERRHKVWIERDRVLPTAEPGPIEPRNAELIAEATAAIRRARGLGRPVILAFGAHAIKNGLAPVLIRLIEEGWVTHLATNGAGIIHDWEFAFQGASSEDVRENAARGEFGLWQETGFILNLALNAGAWQGLGYGESVGALVEQDGLSLPSRRELLEEARRLLEADPSRAAAGADLLDVLRRFDLAAGRLEIVHPYRRFGLQAAAFRLGVPYTAHPMFGHDIIYAHPMNRGAAVGRTAERDFLRFAGSIRDLEGGVYLSVGSAVMSPMIFEKALSMARNIALQEGGRIENFHTFVVDLTPLSWDWQRDGEPPPDNPAYYLRFCKTFSRMGGTMRYLCADNRTFLLTLCRALGPAARPPASGSPPG